MQSRNLLGRSRSQRLLDAIYDQQTKKLRRHHRHHRSARPPPRPVVEVKKEPRSSGSAPVTPLEALHKILKVLPNRTKFAKAVKLLNALGTRENVNHDTRFHFMRAAQVLTLGENCTSVAESRNDVIQFMDKLIGFRDSEADLLFNDCEVEMLKTWYIRSGLENRLKTDDTYQFNNAIDELVPVLSELERGPQAREFPCTRKRERSDLPVCKPESVKRPHEGDDVGQRGFYDRNPETGAVEGVKEELEHEGAKEREATLQKEGESHSIGTDAVSVPESTSCHSTQAPEEPKEEKPTPCPSLGETSIPPEAELLIPLSQAVKEMDDIKRRYFVECLQTMVSYQNKLWARPSIERVMDEVYRKRSIFAPEEQRYIEDWQNGLKQKPSLSSRPSTSVLSIGESANPVKDGRDERIVSIHGSIVWSAKQCGL